MILKAVSDYWLGISFSKSSSRLSGIPDFRTLLFDKLIRIGALLYSAYSHVPPEQQYSQSPHISEVQSG